MSNEEVVIAVVDEPAPTGLPPAESLFLTSTFIRSPTVMFDGHEFEVWNVGGGCLPLFDLAYRARRGDESAVAVLTAFKLIIHDAHGKCYWPVTHKE